MLREQFSDGTKRSPSLPQLDDDIPGRQQVLELLLVSRGNSNTALRTFLDQMRTYAENR